MTVYIRLLFKILLLDFKLVDFLYYIFWVIYIFLMVNTRRTRFISDPCVVGRDFSNCDLMDNKTNHKYYISSLKDETKIIFKQSRITNCIADDKNEVGSGTSNDVDEEVIIGSIDELRCQSKDDVHYTNDVPQKESDTGSCDINVNDTQRQRALFWRAMM